MAQNEIAGYKPQSEWPTLEEMADGFSEHLMPASTTLAGMSMEHILTNGWRIRHEFQEDKLTWTILEGEDAGKSGDASYKAYEVRPDIFLIELVTLLHNTFTGELKFCLSGFVDKENGERRTWTKFVDAIKAGDKPVAAYETTTEMVGKHVLYRYTPRSTLVLPFVITTKGIHTILNEFHDIYVQFISEYCPIYSILHSLSYSLQHPDDNLVPFENASVLILSVVFTMPSCSPATCLGVLQ